MLALLLASGCIILPPSITINLDAVTTDMDPITETYNHFDDDFTQPQEIGVNVFEWYSFLQLSDSPMDTIHYVSTIENEMTGDIFYFDDSIDNYEAETNEVEEFSYHVSFLSIPMYDDNDADLSAPLFDMNVGDIITYSVTADDGILQSSKQLSITLVDASD